MEFSAKWSIETRAAPVDGRVARAARTGPQTTPADCDHQTVQNWVLIRTWICARPHHADQNAIDPVAINVSEREYSAHGIRGGRFAYGTWLYGKASKERRLVKAQSLLVMIFISHDSYAPISESRKIFNRYGIVGQAVDVRFETANIATGRRGVEHLQSHSRQRVYVFTACAQLHLLTNKREEVVQDIAANAAIALNLSEGHASIAVLIQIGERPRECPLRLKPVCDI